MYRTIGDRSLAAHVFTPEGEGPHPAILLFHGGGWVAGEPAWTYTTAERFRDLGLVAIPIEYRLTEGAITPMDAFEDVCAAFRWVRAEAAELGVDPGRIAGHGVSAGAHLLASTETVGCPGERPESATPDVMLLWSPPLDMSLDGWFQSILPEGTGPTDLSPAQHVRETTAPTSIVIGDRDTLTPLRGSRVYCDALIEVGGECDLNVYDGVGHLLTRNLANQESDFDPDPEKRQDGIARHERFLADHGFLPEPGRPPERATPDLPGGGRG